MSTFYRIDSTRVSHLEFLWWHKSPLVLVSWLNKWLRVPTPCSSDDPNTDSTRPFIVESLPPEISEGFLPFADELAGLGFIEPVFHAIHDPGTQATIYWATYRHESGKYFARIHQRLWQRAANPNRALFPLFFTQFADGTFLISSSGKPDMAAPKSVRMNRMPKAATGRLWKRHLELTARLETKRMISPVKSPEDLLAVTEQLQVLLRNFHLARGVFRARSSDEEAKAAGFASQVAQARADGLANPEVMAELDHLQEDKGGSQSSLRVLVASLVLFVILGVARWHWQLTLWLIPVLLLHELGHWLAMRIFQYRNLRMFFIPLFGAAVTGRNWNVPGWKKALVSLAGPLPGIALGVVLGSVGLLLQKNWLDQAALMLLLLNGFNLLPFLPLDGGHVMHATLFCRNRWLDVTFRVLAVIGLFLLGTHGLGRVFTFLAIVIALNLRTAFNLARVTDTLRKAALPPPLPGVDRIPVPTAQAIIAALQGVPPATPSNRLLAQRALGIFETLNAHPPGVMGTIGLLSLHGFALVVALVFSLLLTIGRHDGLGDFFAAAASGPKHKFQTGNWGNWSDHIPGTNDGAKSRVVATFKNSQAAFAEYEKMTNEAPAHTFVTWFGDSLMIALPAGDDAGRNQRFDQLSILTTNIFVAPSNQPVTVNLSFIAPSLPAATNFLRDLNDYFELSGEMHLIPPWSPAANLPDFLLQKQARHQWDRIPAELQKAWEDPELKSYMDRLQTAAKRGDTPEQDRLLGEEQKTRAQLEAKIRKRLGSDPTDPIDADLLDWQAKLSGLSATNRAERAAILRELAPKLGQVRVFGNQPAPGTDTYGAASGMATRHSMMIQVSWLNLNNPEIALPALADWLTQLNCIAIRYDITGSFPAAASDDSADN